MGQAIAVRAGFTAGEVGWFAKRAKDPAQARRLAIAAVLDGASREDAAKIGGMERQTLRDWVIRFNQQGPDGLINVPSPGVPPKLGKKHRAFLVRLVEEGPIPAGPCSFISMRSLQELRQALTQSSSSIRPAGTVPRTSRSPATYRYWVVSKIFRTFDQATASVCATCG